MQRKLYTIWWMVLIRGLVEGLLVVPFLVEPLQAPEELTFYAPAVVLLGGLLEGGMLIWLHEHPFRGILRLIALASIIVGAYLLLVYPATVGMLLVLTGVWMAMRGFAVLWLGLSIVKHPYIRATGVVAGLASTAFGTAAMFWLPPRAGTYALFIAVYALGAMVVHIVVALRMRADKRRVQAEQQAEAQTAGN